MGRSRVERQRDAAEKIREFLMDLEYLVDIVLVEGMRDFEALSTLGYKGEIAQFSQLQVSDVELCDEIAEHYNSILILTDFDSEGREINRNLTKLLERKAIKLEEGLRRQFGRLMASIGVYAVEDLDNSVLRVEDIKSMSPS
jgi:5S rRNA maturation endonuclease (ribonuclease M5)